jgi:Flp pilus assembly protein TadG
MAPLKKLKTLRHGEDGQAIIEMALTLPLLLMIVLGVFDFGLMFQRFEVVTNAAREGARLAVLTSQYSTSDARQRALDYLASGGITGSTCSAGTAGSLCVTVTPGTTTIAGTTPPITVNEMVVAVEYDHQHVFVGPIMGLFGGTLGVTPLKAVSRMRVE